MSNDNPINNLKIEFTGSGSEYFRIWITNMFLILVTLGLYWPWAKARRLRYFWGNTVVNGDPLGFHGDPKQMFKGWVLVAVLIGLYNFASNFSETAGAVAFLVLAALWPALWRSSMNFRMNNTSWRGLRFRFAGSLGDAYKAHLPLVLLLPLPFMLGYWGPQEMENPGAMEMALPFIGIVLLSIALMPWLIWCMKVYQHRNYAIGSLQSDFRASLASFYLVAIKPFFLAAFVLISVGLFIANSFAEAKAGMPSQLLMFLPVALILAWLLFLLGIGPWLTTRMQNLVWTKTGSLVQIESGSLKIRFVSQLSFRSMFLLSLKNGFLMVITLGFYWPFAKIATARLRLEAVHIRSNTELDTLLAMLNKGPEETAGDAAGDFFGLDVGL